MSVEKKAKVASAKPKSAPAPQPARLVRTRLPRNYTWSPTADGRPGYVIQ